MIVLQSTYNAMVKKAVSAEARFHALNVRWNALVDRINKKGGETFLKKAQIQQVPQFDEGEIAKLIQLCHPDKHDGKPMATEMTAKLLALKNKITKAT